MPRLRGQKGRCSSCGVINAGHNAKTCPLNQQHFMETATKDQKRRRGEYVESKEKAAKKNRHNTGVTSSNTHGDATRSSTSLSIAGISQALVNSSSNNRPSPAPGGDDNGGLEAEDKSTNEGPVHLSGQQQQQIPEYDDGEVEKDDFSWSLPEAQETVSSSPSDPGLDDDPTVEDTYPSHQSMFMMIEMKKIKDCIQLKVGRRSKSKEEHRLIGSWPLRDYWIHPKEPSFSQSGDAVDPFTYCLKKLCVWVPEYIHTNVFTRGVLFCPKCKTDANVQSEGFNPHGPRRVYDVDDVYYVICKRYKCRSCKVSFNGYSKSVVDLMSHDIAKGLPCVVTHRAAFSRRLLELMRHTVTTCGGSGVSGYHTTLQKMYSRKYLETKEEYYCVLARAQAFMVSSGLSVKLTDLMQDNSTFLSRVRNPEEFPEFDQEYQGHVPSITYLSEILQVALEKREPYLDRRMQMTTCRVLKGDCTMKIAKKVRIGGDAILSALYTGFNEFHEVVTFSFLESESSTEVEKLLEGLNKRQEVHGFDKVQYVYVDNCCKFADTYRRCLPQLQEKATTTSEDALREAQQQEPLQAYTIPKDCVTITTVGAQKKTEASFASANLLCSTLTDDDVTVCGLDVEWIKRDAEKRDRIALIQLAYRSPKDGILRVLLFRTHQVKSSLPTNLCAILSNPNIKKVGRCIGTDARYISDDFKIQVNGVVDIAGLAVSKGFRDLGNSSLSTLCEVILCKTLKKAPGVRISNWANKKDLTDEQKMYAAMDAASSLDVFLALQQVESVVDLPRPSKKDISKSIDSSPSRKAASVYLLNSTESTVIGEGDIYLEENTSRRVCSSFNRSVAIDDSKVVVKISSPTVPAAILPLYQDDPMKRFHAVTIGKAVSVSVVWPLRYLRLKPSTPNKLVMSFAPQARHVFRDDGDWIDLYGRKEVDEEFKSLLEAQEETPYIGRGRQQSSLHSTGGDVVCDDSSSDDDSDDERTGVDEEDDEDFYDDDDDDALFIRLKYERCDSGCQHCAVRVAAENAWMKNKVGHVL